MSRLTVEVRQKSNKGQTGWEGRVTVPGTNATKLAKRDGATLFRTRGSLSSVARALGKRLNLDVELSEQRKAAKKYAKRRTARKTK